MNKHKFIELVENPSSILEKDTDILSELALNYPYSSLVRSMQAKALQNSPQAKSSLATAALYIPDRKVLKAVMENRLDRPAASLASPIPHNETAGTRQPAEAKSQNPEAADALSNIQSLDEVEENPELAKVPHNVVDELQENLRQLREQRQRFQEQDDAPAAKKEEEPSSQPAKGNNIIPSQLPERLQELLMNKEELPIDDPKRIEQINLIDSFIQNSSAISRKYRTLDNHSETQSDLTSREYNTPTDLVTENLAQIMVRQGKTDKAIDIYEKLILKYPQKSAYFASCIEKLKTSL